MSAFRVALIAFSIFPVVFAASGAANSQTSSTPFDTQGIDPQSTVDFAGWTVPDASRVGAQRPGSCDLRDAVSIAPTPYCGFGGGLTLRRGSGGSPDLLGFLTQTEGDEDIVWLDFDYPSHEIGRCSPDSLNVITGMANNDRSFCGSSNTLFVANHSHGRPTIFELAVDNGSTTSNRQCGPEDSGEDVVGAQSCDILREFGISQIDDDDNIRALAFAEPPSLGHPVLVASAGIDLVFMVSASTDCRFSTLNVVHKCRLSRSAWGLAWLGADRFLVSQGFGRMDILDIAGRGCEMEGSFHAPGNGQVGGATYDSDRELLVVTEGLGGELYAVPLNPTDLDPVAVAEPDAFQECGPGSTFFVDGRGSCDPDDNFSNLNFIWTAPDGQEFSGATVRVPTPPLGTHTYELEVDDGRGNSDRDLQEVTVIDTREPRIVSLAASPAELWPPNGKFVPVTVAVEVDERCDPEPRCTIIEVESSDPSSTGDLDWKILSDLELALRAERGGTGDRTYTITVECQDESGNASDLRTALVHVPHNDVGSTCACWSREELKSIAPNPDTDTWSLSCQRGDDVLPDSDRIRRSFGRLGHMASAQSGDVTGEYSCQYSASIPDQPRVSRYRRIDAEAYAICRDQVRLRQTILGITDECSTN